MHCILIRDLLSSVRAGRTNLCQSAILTGDQTGLGSVCLLPMETNRTGLKSDGDVALYCTFVKYRREEMGILEKDIYLISE